MTNIIQGRPTKKFFIDMITRDISIEDAIIDLIDNSIDGANRLNQNSYEGLTIDITINPDEFIIQDNCGGFSLKNAINYAFRFGRPNDAPIEKNSIGRFGIGMKRALFKMGKEFSVESKHKEDHYIVNVDVDKWNEKSDVDGKSWDFDYENCNDEGRLKADGTYIYVRKLNNGVKDIFGDSGFISSMQEAIRRMLSFSLEKGITIRLNGEKIVGTKLDIIQSDNVKPYIKCGVIQGVKFRIFAGLGDIGTTDKSGWYIYCNGRLVLEHDRTSVTGWGVGNIKQWHVEDVMFRGVVLMDTEETINLPLTTTKRGVDASHPVYMHVLYFMKEAMRQIIPYLSQIAKMGDQANGFREDLYKKENKDSLVTLNEKALDINYSQDFVSIPPDENIIADKQNTRRISYSVPKKDAERAKDHAEVDTFKELGEETFNYYMRQEGLTK
ncbi:ATP-binding protein [Hallella absiana]|uniref:ATP-binding protein n=1 Tax=Hallella absiana TaxID=2925336 RepID=UPI0021C9AE95|nr:ATP-binding protein [Hallella absiana]